MRGVLMTKSAGRRKAFGAALKRARKAQGMTQRTLAARLAELGDEVTEASLSGYERGEYAPDVDRARRLEQILEVPLVALLGFPDEPAVTVADLERRIQVIEAMVEELVRRERGDGPASPPNGGGGRPDPPT